MKGFPSMVYESIIAYIHLIKVVLVKSVLVLNEKR